MLNCSQDSSVKQHLIKRKTPNNSPKIHNNSRKSSMKNSYTVVNASAGSGKTYYLVQQVLLICLRYPNSEKKIGHILALTFTNKAANEMKERILEWLKNFATTDCNSNPDLKNLQSKLVEEGIRVSLEDLQERSQNLLNYILHHYSILNISTIDKFNTRLVRSFSNELGLAKNFNLEIKAEPYLKEAIDQLLDNIGEDEFYSNLFMDFMNYHFENNSNVKLNDQLFNASKSFLGDHHYEYLKRNKNFDIQHYVQKTKELRNEIHHHKTQIAEIAQKALQLLSEKDLEISDFSGGKTNGIAVFFHKIYMFAQGMSDTFPLPKDEDTAQQVFAKVCSKTGLAKENQILEILDYLLGQRQEIIANYIAQQKKEKILAALLPLKVNKDIQDELSKIEEENDLVFLSKFNALIKENLQNEPSAFIYEKIGTQFQYFFFDEFQDTSDMQWQNFVPLRDNAIAMDDTGFTVVGDPKQSIYRFRGGDSRLMLQLINHTEEAPRPAEVIVLENNWRSAKNIVEFNNALYAFHAQFLEENHRNIFGTDAQQQPQKKGVEGRVKVNLIENSTKDFFYTEVADTMHANIQECLDNGFQLSDITILCRGNQDIVKFSQLLGNKKVNYQGQEIYLKTLSEKGLILSSSQTIKALIAFFNWKINTQNRRYLAETLYWLTQLGRISPEDFSAEIFSIFEQKDEQLLLTKIKEKYNLDLGSHRLPQLNLYNYAEHYLKEFSVPYKETDFILNFLELIHGFTQSTGLNLKDLIQFWNEEGSETSIQASENIDAVQLMTIHKAKGLEFPIVFYPMKNSSKEGTFIDWFDLEDELLPHVYISQFKQELMAYDESIQQYNEEHSYENKIDGLCVQYVATTRPVEQLFLYIEKESKTGKKLEILDFLETFNPEQKDAFDLYPGDYRKSSKDKINNTQTQKIDEVFPNIANQSSIKIATPSKNYQHKNEKVKRGIFVHEILSKIKTGKEVEKVLQNYLLNGILDTEESKQLASEIQQIIDRYPQFFHEDVLVINEREIMLSTRTESEIYRPDRLVVDSKGDWHIIDFKTGKEKDEHQKQVQRYQKVLEKLGYKVGSTHLIYL